MSPEYASVLMQLLASCLGTVYIEEWELAALLPIFNYQEKRLMMVDKAQFSKVVGSLLRTAPIKRSDAKTGHVSLRAH